MAQGSAGPATAFAADIVGREGEISAVAAFLDARLGRSAALVIEGEAGIGKTTIVRTALERASNAATRVLWARPTAGEMELPYAGLGDLLAGVRPAALRRLAGPQRAAIEAALLRQGSSATVDGHALSRGVLELLQHEAAAGDLLVAVDDVQWLDRPTATALTFALRRLDDTPVRVLAAVRIDPRSRAELPLGLSAWQDVERMKIGPLAATQLGALLRLRLAETLPSPRLKALRDASGGNPMFAIELARQGYPVREGSAADSLTLALAERLRALEPETRGALAHASAALRPSPELLLQAGVGREALKSALETDVLSLEGDRLTFAHPLLGAAAYESLLPEERREIHSRLAAASTDIVERGHHVSRFALAPDDRAGETLDRAAARAADLGDHAGAAAFLLRAAELSADREAPLAWGREQGAAEELERAGDVEGAIAVSRGLLGRLPSGTPRARARLLLAQCSGAWELSHTLDQLGLALDDASDDLGLQAELYLAMAETAAALCRLDDGVAWAGKAIELAEAAGSESTIGTIALSELGFLQCMAGQGVTDAARDAFDRWDPDQVWPPTYSPRMSLGCVLLYTGAYDEAEDLLEAEREAARGRGLEPIEVMAQGLLSETQMRAGRWSEALSNGRIALEHARQAAHEQIVAGASYMPAVVLALLGQPDEAREMSAGALVEAEAIHDFWFGNYHRAVLGLVALTDDEPQAAIDVLTPAWTRMLACGLGELSIFPVAHILGEALVAVGCLDEAMGVAQTLQDCPAGKRPWCRAMAFRIGALVASARGDHQAALAKLADSLDAHAELAEPFEHARTVHLGGRIRRSARNWGAARADFVEALERFDALGAARWAEKAAADIARLPGRRPSGDHGLTLREREVAELVAGGLANKEVAAKLFLSVSTVEATLSKVYAKLGVRSRTGLAARLGAPEDG